ncbi:MAG TPA: DEAD/DEAH box helicase [Solirubrobacteraceae bacterium]|nr:DEAD/DEAH box helicase [Solirubrobacteraceae bacterium]
MATIHSLLAEIRETSLSQPEKGERFERLMKAYLGADPQFVEQFSDVWLWSEWPDNNGKGDTGIDLVARERDESGFCAIQCKFYAPDHHLQKKDIDSFFTASGKAPFTSRLIISTTDKWGKNAEDALEQQQIPVRRIGLAEIGQSPVSWSVVWPAAPDEEISLEVAPKHQLRLHQTKSVEKVFQGFESHDRGKLIMACGTGKTFTALKIVERLASERGGDTNVLFLVPSISLLSQALREWTAQCQTPMRCFAVCSDTKVGKRSTSEDIRLHDLAFPATTDPQKLLIQIKRAQQTAQLTVVVSTYQSIATVAAAQEAGLPKFDLAICDEAHRTTGVTLADSEESHFVRIHDAEYIKAAKRLYMTATPRLFDDSTKSSAAENAAVLCSMDDEALYGREFHRLGFGEAVNGGLLTDYKVLILTVDESYVARSLQSEFADHNHELNIGDIAKIVGCWNGLAKRSGTTSDGSGFAPGETPMRRAVAFSRSIKESEALTEKFAEVIDNYEGAEDDALRCEVRHVDGTYNALRRNEQLDWLKGEMGANECRILSNARCLSEGVDVPALDAVLFLNPRNSVVDVVQSVGRVMRRAEGKDYGYIILPVGIPADVTPEQALADNKRYKVVWQVLQALRAHDDRFNATVNKIELNKHKPTQIMVGAVGFATENNNEPSGGSPQDAGQGAAAAAQLALSFPVDEWREAIYAKIVTKVGERAYWETWAKDVAQIAERHVTRIDALLADPSSDVQKRFEEFVAGLRVNLNDSITNSDAVDMLAQHLITRPVFEALFEDYSFAEHNPVSQAMQGMLGVLDEQHVDTEAETLEKFYDSVRMRAADIDNAEGKQRIIAELYERFFKVAFPRVADSLGIVYTPVEIVDFIIRSVEHVLEKEFGASVSDEGVHVLEPFAGTGTFIVRLLQSGVIKPEDLARKYATELHANEILLLAYYIAAINIEATYHDLAGGEYTPFSGIVLTDTFQMTESAGSMDQVIFPDNNERALHQKALDIRVILGNPPYSAGQDSENDNNKNLVYPALDQAIAETYAAQSSATNKNSLYDSYIRAFRWASDRIKGQGIVAFVSNGSFIDGASADGFRKILATEFSSVFVFNLRGNQRTSGDTSQREGGKVFGQGSRNSIAITLLIKNPGANTPCVIHYHDIGDYLSRDEKLSIIRKFQSIASIPWQYITPDAMGDWIEQRNNAFVEFAPLGDKKRTGGYPLFSVYSMGLQSKRDAWVYNFSHTAMLASVRRMVAFYNEQLSIVAASVLKSKRELTPAYVNELIDQNAKKISWTRGLKADLRRSKAARFDEQRAVVSAYRPYCKQWLYFDRQFNDMVLLMPKLFPTASHDNIVIASVGVGASRPFSTLITSIMPSHDFVEKGQCFPRFFYEPATNSDTLFTEHDVIDGYRRRDAITDETLASYQSHYDNGVTKEDIFYYIYGLLHSPTYKQRYAADLKKMIPRIPMVADFRGFSDAGRRLAAWHLNYEEVDPWPLDEVASAGVQNSYRVEKMRFGKDAKAVDKTRITYNTHLTLAGIPEEAYRYEVNGKSAIEWIMDRYQVKTDRDSGIVNDPNDWALEHENPRYIVDLVKRIVSVSMATVDIVERLPDLELLEENPQEQQIAAPSTT